MFLWFTSAYIKICLLIIFKTLIYFQFIKFANIEEDTPSYHRRYDFFVSKFSVMSHNADRNENVRAKYVLLDSSIGLNVLNHTAMIFKKIAWLFKTVFFRIRGAGLLGLQGVVRKTVSDDLQVNIWDPVHMDKIVPSLLFNMHTPE